MLPVTVDLIVERPPEVRWLLPFLPSLPPATSLFHSVYSSLLFTSEDATHNSPRVYQYMGLPSTGTPPAGWLSPNCKSPAASIGIHNHPSLL